MKLLRTLFPLVVPCHVLAFPLAYNKSTVTAKTCVPLIVISVSLFFLLVAIKFVYLKYRIGTIHAPPRVHVIPTGSNSSSRTLRNKQGNRHYGFLVGCLGSPTWETDLTSRLDVATWRREQTRSPGSTMRSAPSASARIKSENASSNSRLTSCSNDADLPLVGHSRIPTVHSSRSFGSVQPRRHPGYSDFGESRGATRRASPSSIRLVHGPSYSSQVEYSFLSGLPPDAIVASPLMSTRDSFQLSRCSSKYNRRAVPPLPPLPLFLPFHLPEDSPPLRFSPLVSAAKVFHSQQRAVESKASRQTLDPDESDAASSTCVIQDTPPLHIIHKESPSYKALAILENSVDSKKPLKSCLRHKVCTCSISETTTPISDVDIGILGLDRFRWNDEPIVQACHMKKDSVALDKWE